MKTSTKEIVYWTPRVICILFAFFMSLFSFDVFSEGYGFWETIIALLTKLLPVIILIILLVISWRWEWVGAISFNFIGFVYVVYNWGKIPFVTHLGITGPMFVVGILFFLNWIYKDEISIRISIR
jgi:hypothetical protein